jgi:hypothetical protein
VVFHATNIRLQLRAVPQHGGKWQWLMAEHFANMSSLWWISTPRRAEGVRVRQMWL